MGAVSQPLRAGAEQRDLYLPSAPHSHPPTHPAELRKLAEAQGVRVEVPQWDLEGAGPSVGGGWRVDSVVKRTLQRTWVLFSAPTWRLT